MDIFFCVFLSGAKESLYMMVWMRTKALLKQMHKVKLQGEKRKKT